jgi:hemerythrin-like domain-containing protein
MDAFNLLKTDHQKVAELFDKLEAASGKAKLDVFKQIKTELELHTHIEEKFFYPALEKPKQTHDLALEAYEEHDVVKKLLTQMSRARTANDEWEAQAKVLRENVEHHVDEEENELFPKAEQVLSDEDIEMLGNDMQAEKERKQTRTAGKRSSAKKSASKTKSASTAAKRARSSKKSASKSGSKSSTTKRSRSKKSSGKKSRR